MHLFADGSEISKTVKDEVFTHWVYEDSLIADTPWNTLYLHLVSQALVCIVCMIISMCRTDTYMYFDYLNANNSNEIGWRDPYGSTVSDMDFAWIPCAFAFMLCGLTEAFLPF